MEFITITLSDQRITSKQATKYLVERVVIGHRLIFRNT